MRLRAKRKSGPLVCSRRMPEGEWARKDFQAEGRLVLEKKEDSWSEAGKQRIEQGVQDERRRAMKKAVDQLDHAWESRVKSKTEAQESVAGVGRVASGHVRNGASGTTM
jgi:hypothetical protein